MNSIRAEMLKNTIERKFDIEQYKKFVKEFFNEVEEFSSTKHIGIWREYLEHVNSYYAIANYTDSQENKIVVMAVELKKDVSVDRARSMQRNFISKYLDEKNCDAAIVAFYTDTESSWRLSFVRLDYTYSDKGLELDLTPARRYSYLVGESEPNHTVMEQLLPIFEDDKNNPTLDEIENAFSVEKVTSDFFNKYKDKYLDLKEYLENHDAFISETKKLGFEINKFSEQFAKKTMGQLAFLYFIQKKGWLGVKILPESRELTISEFKKINDAQDDIHKNILDRLFRITKTGKMKLFLKEFATINDHEAGLLSDCFVGTEFDMPWGNGEKKFIRGIFDFCTEKTNKNFFNDYLQPFFYLGLNKKKKNHYFKTFNCKIPFLNGGLFEPIEDYHWQDVNFEIPNEIFSNEKEKGRNANGILDIFDHYNFTMNEDEPLEKEVAIDPEMLGKIFENLLDVKDRKSKGAFYTPREIVHYMCQESLINYLVNEVNVPYEDMKEFILYGELIKDSDSRSNVGYGRELTIKQSIFDNIVKIDNALKNVRISDPAVGSGAFPLGMLNEIVKARNNITEYIIKKDKEGYFGRRYGKEQISKGRSPYKIKWDTIKDCIFAVDIEPSAVDITKLRLWLSIIVDQEIDDDNPEPHPLPNLDMNIHVGNSLIDEYEGIKLFDSSVLNSEKKSLNQVQQEQIRLFFDSDEILNEMYERQSQYFDENDENKKRELKNDIEVLRDQLITHKLHEEGNIDALEKYNLIKEEKNKPFFIWELEFSRIFKEKSGFDIVIGNPPYIDSEEMVKNAENIREIYRNKYFSARGNWDIFVIFIEKGLILLKNNGVISYIVPNKLIGAKYTEDLRKIIINYQMKEIRDYSSVEVFKEASVYPIVFMIEKNNIKNSVNINIMNSRSHVKSNIIIEPELFYRDIFWDRYLTDNQETINIIEKILKGINLDRIATVRGSATVSEAYDVKENLIEFHSEESEDGFKKFINTGTIDRYVSLWGYKNTRYIKETYFQPVIENNSIKTINMKRYIESTKEKIIVGGMNKYLECYLDRGDYLAGKSTSIIYDPQINILYILGILNSKLMSFFYRNYFKSLSLSGGYLRIGPPQLVQLPIVINNEKMNFLCDLVKKLISYYLSSETSSINEYEGLLNNCIYNIYEINDEEIKIIEKEWEIYYGRD